MYLRIVKSDRAASDGSDGCGGGSSSRPVCVDVRAAAACDIKHGRSAPTI
ncbi:hypothetical protein NP493_263g02000 [Ridgeia piscesae]|uniref:Uncharacterized protein n=1 Tax=Ridgeia piscesae TaxID=27915 RepID=A0AAD9UCQ8_RIDPI|nr:hypothetical protein NP493_263g02000 [Ridgeia piscesae]